MSFLRVLCVIEQHGNKIRQRFYYDEQKDKMFSISGPGALLDASKRLLLCLTGAVMFLIQNEVCMMNWNDCFQYSHLYVVSVTMRVDILSKAIYVTNPYRHCGNMFSQRII